MQRILLVEDNEMNRDLITRRLKRRGYEVLIATDGAAGVETATREKPDLVLMDISLPLLDGYEATRLIKDNADTRHTPVIGLSAHAMSGDANRAMEAGCDDYDTKPIEWPRLLEKIGKLLERAAERQAAEATPEDAASSPGTGVRLLVVSDSAMRSEMMSARLGAMGHAFTAVDSVDAASEQLGAHRFDAVLLDVSVPGTGSRSALEQIRGAGQGQPIFMLCAIDAVADAIACFEHGAAEFIPQPFRAEELRHRLDTHLELSRHRHRPPAPDGDSGAQARQVEHLMRSLLPPAWIEELRRHRKLPPRRLENVALLQWDLPALSQQLAMSSVQAMARLQRVTVAFEEIAASHGARVVGLDNLGVLSLVEGEDGKKAVRAAVACGLETSRKAAEIGEAFRAAVHTGPVLAGVVGHRTWRFGLWGGAVTLVQQACHSVASSLHATDTAWRALGDQVRGEPSGKVPIEGGSLPLHRVDRLT